MRTIRGVPVDVIAAEVERIEAERGVCAAAALVAAARPKRSPLHGLFEWDNTRAAERWREHQARNVINMIVVDAREGYPSLAPRFVAVTHATDDGVQQGYMSTHVALAGPHRDQVLRDALGALNGLRRRYQSLRELADVWAALDEAEAA